LKLSSVTILNRCRYVTADNIELSAVILELLLIIGISGGSNSKIRNNYNSHTNYNSNISSYTVINHIQTHTQVHKHNKYRYIYI
jgi:hypothetical protein